MVDVKAPKASAVQIRGLTGQWGSFILHQLDLDIKPGEYIVLLGPSGCGKTTLMELLCGLRHADSGEIRIGGHDLTRAEPEQRRVGYVPQDYDLFPTATVEKNVRFAARMRWMRGPRVEARFTRLVEMLRIGGILGRDVRTLSGGEQQRAALARALMAEPALLLLDEPVSALPESHRDTVCGELRRLHDELGITTVHVSHNLEEALLVADRVAVMDNGRLVQLGKPEEVLDKPASRFVAEFTRCKNIWPGTVKDGALTAGDATFPTSGAPDGPCWAVIRPERLCLCTGCAAPNALHGKVVGRSRSAHAVLSELHAGALTIWTRDDQRTPVGAVAAVSIPTEHLHLIPRKPGD